jgi:hypothetical protein
MSMDSNLTSTSDPPERAKIRRSQWVLIIGLLLGPAILALFAAMAKLEVVATAIPLVAGGIGGIYLGTFLGRRLGKTTGSKVFLGVLFSAVFGCCIVGVGFFGCMLGGFHLDFK